MRRFEFDYDTTWVAFFLDADLNVYSRYGGRDSGEPDDRLSRDSLLQTMDEVLEAHEYRMQNPKVSPQDMIQPQFGEPRTPESIPLLKENHQGCVHCHQIREYRLLQSAHDQSFRKRQLYPYPLPENLGIQIDRTHGHRVSSVIEDSPAAAAGMHAGDVVNQVNRIPVRSEFDLRWAMHNHTDDTPLTLHITSATDDRTKIVITQDSLPKGWRIQEIGWRKSLRSVPLDLGFRGYSLTPSQLKALNLPPDQFAIKVVSVRNRGIAKRLDIRRNDVILSGKHGTRRLQFPDLVAKVLRVGQVGEALSMTVLRKGDRIELSGPFPEWTTEETTVP